MSFCECSRTKIGHNIAPEIVFLVIIKLHLFLSMIEGNWNCGMLYYVGLAISCYLGIFALRDKKNYRLGYGAASVSAVALIVIILFYSAGEIADAQIETISEAVEVAIDDDSVMFMPFVYLAFATGIVIPLVVAIRHTIIAHKTRKKIRATNNDSSPEVSDSTKLVDLGTFCCDIFGQTSKPSSYNPMPSEPPPAYSSNNKDFFH